MMVAEMWIDHVARHLDKPSHEIRTVNMYKEDDATHFGQQLQHCRVPDCWRQVRFTCGQQYT